MAYPNKLRIEGQSDSFMADPDNAAIGIWLRCKLNAEATTPDGTPALVLASATERGSYVTLAAHCGRRLRRSCPDERQRWHACK
jgi:hypothetical protein